MGREFIILLLVLVLAPLISATVSSKDDGTGKSTSDAEMISESNGKISEKDKLGGETNANNESGDSKNNAESTNFNNNHLSTELELKGDTKKKDASISLKENVGSSSEFRKKKRFPGQKCDSSSNSCMDESKSLLACLRVPGDESRNLSLLIENKAKGALHVSISAPDFVQLEKKEIQLRETDHEEVMVAVGDGGPDHMILLMTGTGNCSLDFRNTIQGSSAAGVTASLPSTNFTILSVLLFVASLSFCIGFWHFRRRYWKKAGNKYQRLDMELPVSNGTQVVIPSDEGWNDSWGDGWDDEEAPQTVNSPAASSHLHKSAASRRLAKDSWND